MRKSLIWIFVCMQFCMINTSFVYGEYIYKYMYGEYIKEDIYTVDTIVYINNAPIKAYGYDNTKPMHDFFIYAEDLERYGFDVTWEKNRLIIKRIPGKQPDEMTPEEYKELTTRDEFGKLVPGFYYDTGIRLFLDENEMLPFSYAGVISSEKGHLIMLRDLLEYYGSYSSEFVRDLNGKIIEDSTGYPIQDVYIDIKYDYAISGTSLTKKRFRTIESLESFISSKKNIDTGNLPALYGVMHDYTEKGKRRYFNIWVLEKIPEGKKRIEARYIKLEILEDFGLEYEFTDNTLEIPFGQSVKKEDVGYLFNKDVTCYKHMNAVSMSCVDLKLLSDGKEIGKKDVFPPIINRGGSLYIKLQSLAEIVKVDGKTEKLGILEEPEIIKKKTEAEVLEEVKIREENWKDMKENAIKPLANGAVVFIVGVLCIEK